RSQNFHTLIRSGQEIEAAANLFGRQTSPHTFDLLRDFYPVFIMGEVVLELADRRLVLRDLLVIGPQLCLELAFALHVIGTLEPRVSSLRRQRQRRAEIAMREFRLGA